MRSRIKQRYRSLMFATSVMTAGVVIASGLTSRNDVPNRVDPLNHPDEFAWQTFARISIPRGPVANNTVDWETWADDDLVFGNANVKPIWPAAKPRRIKLKRAIKDAPTIGLSNFKPEDVPVDKAALPPSSPSQISELTGSHPLLVEPDDKHPNEVRMNFDSFKYIVNNNLWYVEGQEAFLKQNPDLKFPKAAIEIKAMWVKIRPDQRFHYHSQKGTNDQWYGLAGLHITTKDLPDWFWATFEHVDNPRRGKILPYTDRFGFQRNSMTPALARLFRKFKLGPEWANYRLAGTQTAFRDKEGRLTLAGNSVIEGNDDPKVDFQRSSSCIACHQQSAIDASGIQLSFFRSVTPRTGFVGQLDPADLLDKNGKRLFLKRDFVWSMMHAKRRVNPPPPPDDPSFAHDIVPLFTPSDIAEMTPRGVPLNNYAYMSVPANAIKVLGRLMGATGDVMPPGHAWASSKINMFVRWMNKGYKP